MPLAPGSRLGPYEVVSSLGAGGMGEVWRARDTRLGREVAIKVLAAHLTDQPEVRTRFEREARAISSLNHPHICVLHDVGREGDTDYLVMELIDGETLARRLKRGALPVPEALRIGAQIADALDRAHRSGIVHRDLKPGNVMLAKSGAKLMDFGLARAHGDGTGPLRTASGDLSISPTMSRPLTAEGSIVGTFQYMAPEQLEGSEADARSDVWSFGCLLYEMVTGRPAFEGRSAASLIGSILKDEPPPLVTPGDASGEPPPPELERLVRRCLAKEPDERWQSAADLKHELQWMSGATTSSTAVPRPAALPVRTSRKLPAGWLVGAAGVLIALASLLLPRFRTAEPERVLRFDVREREGLRLDVQAEAALSPDGARLAFVGEDSAGVTRLFVRDLNSNEIRTIPGVGSPRLPFWSPDSRWLGYFSGGNLDKVPVEGGSPVQLAPAPDPRGGAWSPRGVIVFAPFPEGPIHRVSADGGQSQAITSLDRPGGERSHRYPSLLPDGRHFLFTAVMSRTPHRWYMGDLEGGKARRIGEGETAPVWSPNGYVLWNANHRLMARAFSPGSGKLSGEPRVVANGAFNDNFGYPNVTAAAGGLLFYQSLKLGRVRLTWRAPDGTETTAFPDLIPAETDLSLSSDGRRVVYGSLQSGAYDFWLQDLAGGPPTRLTSDGAYKTAELWSPDDRRMLYARTLGQGGYEARIIDFEAGTDTLLTRTRGVFAMPTSWSRDGRQALLACSDSTGHIDTWIAPTDGSGPARIWQHTPPEKYASLWSPDEHWVITAETSGAEWQILAEPFSGPGPRSQLSTPSMDNWDWSPDGKTLYVVLSSGVIQAIPVEWGARVRFGVPRTVTQLGTGLQVFRFARNPRGLLLARRTESGRVASLEGILHWPQLIARP